MFLQGISKGSGLEAGKGRGSKILEAKSLF